LIIYVSKLWFDYQEYDRLKIYFAVSIYWIEQKYLNNIIDGGNADTIKMLLDRGANPNTQGYILSLSYKLLK
jgi:hypothetical protein